MMFWILSEISVHCWAWRCEMENNYCKVYLARGSNSALYPDPSHIKLVNAIDVFLIMSDLVKVAFAKYSKESQRYLFRWMCENKLLKRGWCLKCALVVLHMAMCHGSPQGTP